MGKKLNLVPNIECLTLPPNSIAASTLMCVFVDASAVHGHIKLRSEMTVVRESSSVYLDYR